MIDLRLCDCLDGLETLEDNSIDAVVTDPPYYQVKGDFDFAFKSFDQYKEFIENCAIKIRRVLKPNGSIIWFGDAKNIAYNQVIFDKYFELINVCVWEKIDGQQKKNSFDSLRCFLPVTERFLFYEQQSTIENKTGLEAIYSNKDCFLRIKTYMREQQRLIMEHNGFKTIAAFNEYINAVTETSSVASRHYFADSQWIFPTAEMWQKLQTTGFFRQEYEELRQEYEELRQEYEELRRPFNGGIFKFNDVIQHSQDSYETGAWNHPTKKPIRLMRKLIETITKKDMLVLDLFSGSGSIAAACMLSGRNCIAFEKDPKYYEVSKARIEHYETIKQQQELFV